MPASRPVPHFFLRQRTSRGQASPDAEPTLSRLAPGIIKVDAHRGFSPLALERGDGPLADLAEQQGIAALVVNNALNVAALWPEVERLAERGLVAFAYVSAIPYVAPAGGIKPVFGTNPMAFAWPRLNRPPLVFDQAASASARGEIQAALAGWQIAAGGLGDRAGRQADNRSKSRACRRAASVRRRQGFRDRAHGRTAGGTAGRRCSEL